MRTIFLAMSVAIFFAGCANTGPGDEIGVSSSAISVANFTTGTAMTAREYPGSCVIKDKNNTEFMIVAGGFASNGAALDDVLALDPSSGTGWFQIKNAGNTDQKLSVARGHLRLIQDPADAHRCWAVGGASTDTGNAIAASGSNFVVESITADATNAGKFSLAHDDGAGHNYAQIARTRFELRACPSTNKIVTFGGVDNSGTLQTAVNTFDRSSTATAWANPTSLSAARADLGVAQDGSNFVAIAGDNGGTGSTAIDLLKTSGSCGTWAASVSSQSLPNSRYGNAAVFLGSNKFASTGGKTSLGNASGVSVEFVVNWTTTLATYTSNPATGTALNNSVVTYLPSYLNVSSTAYVVGGTADDVSGMTPVHDTFATDAAQESYWSSASLASNGRTHGALEYLPSQTKLYYTAGAQVVSGTKTLLTTTQAITP